MNMKVTCLDETNIYSLWLLNTVAAVILYVDDVVLLSKSRSCSWRFQTKNMSFFTSSSFDVNLSKTKNMIFGWKEVKPKNILPMQGPNWDKSGFISTHKATLNHRVKGKWLLVWKSWWAP